MKHCVRFNKSLVRAVLFSATLLAGSAFASSIQGSFQRSYTVNGPVDLEALTRSGDITIHSGPAGTVTIIGKINVADRWLVGDRHAMVSQIEQNPPIRQNGNSIHIDLLDGQGAAVRDHGIHMDYLDGRGICVDYEITLPPESAVRTESGSGDQRVEGMRGKLELRSGSGDMRLRNTGAVRVHTGSGDVEALDISGTFAAEAGSGDIRVEGRGLGDVNVTTGSGNIELRGVKGALEAESASGDVTVEGEQTGSWKMHTSSGNVELRLPDNAAFDLDASTGSGEIETGRQVVAMVQGKIGGSRSAISGKANGGGPQLTVHTGSGDIRIK
jgi:DUF4097 and DUF4098 domain-containing protein YvlB